jgi:hypothetical protein
MKILCTFSGKFGDILWSVPTVKHIADHTGELVDFGIMPAYESLLPLLNRQPYIDHAFVIKDWICVGSPHGDQPWEAPVPEGSYDKVYHLTYRNHPGYQSPALIDFIAAQQGMTLQNPLPCIEAERSKWLNKVDDYVTFSFNEQIRDKKDELIARLTASFGEELPFIDVTKESWERAAELVRDSVMHLTDRSALWVLACLVGQKEIYSFEPNSSRNQSGPFGKVFGCPYVQEKSFHYNAQVDMVAPFIRSEILRLVKEKEIA